MDERIDNRLHRYFDGDLTPGEAAELRERLDDDPALRSKLDGLREVRGAIRESVAPAALDIPSEDLWAKIDAQLVGVAAITAPIEASSTRTATITSQSAMTSQAAERSVEGKAIAAEAYEARPIEARPIEARPIEARPLEAGPLEAGPLEAEPFEARRPALRVVEGGQRTARPIAPDASRRRVTTIVIAGLAIAAAVLLLVLRPGEPDVGGSAPLAQVDDTGEPTAVEPTTEEIVSRTEVLEVDFGDNSGAIFAVEGDDGAQYAVVWLADVQPKQTAVE